MKYGILKVDLDRTFVLISAAQEWLILRRLGITNWLDKDKLNILSLSKTNVFLAVASVL